MIMDVSAYIFPSTLKPDGNETPGSVDDKTAK